MLAHWTPAARLGWIHGHADAGWQWLKVPVHGVGAYRFNLTAKLVPENERFLDQDFTNASVFIAVQIAATNARRRHADERMTRARRPWLRESR